MSGVTAPAIGAMVAVANRPYAITGSPTPVVGAVGLIVISPEARAAVVSVSADGGDAT